GLAAANLHWDSNTIFVGIPHGIPPNAPQPGVDYPLDTGDNRFENRSLQSGSRILTAATVSGLIKSGGLATAVWFDFNIGVSSHTFQNYNFWFASSTSSD